MKNTINVTTINLSKTIYDRFYRVVGRVLNPTAISYDRMSAVFNYENARLILQKTEKPKVEIIAPEKDLTSILAGIKRIIGIDLLEAEVV
ncbi:hypothetical protein J4217_03920 [Candidatus Pacearchaeota archaeon]|nr:hypothetical protein [uncultured archaeon]AQS33213.1 hypothetical protein [uncultured archaeon]MBS3091567.1 hypothetical protein [Candidatus Pacearchaeota archaeon]